MVLKIYIAISPLGIKNAELQMSQYSNPLVQETNILINPSSYNADQRCWSKIISNEGFRFESIQTTITAKLKYQLQRIYYSKKLFRTVKKLTNQQGISQVEFFIQNLEDPLSNLCFFFNWQKNTQFNLIEDGIANYYDYYKTFPQMRKRLHLKILFHRLFNFKYLTPKSFTGITYSRMSTQFVRFPEMAENSKKSKKLEVSELSFHPKIDTVLIIGQESYEIIYGYEKYVYELQEMILKIKAKYPDHKILYKPHWNTAINLSKILDKIEVINSKATVEELVPALAPSVIISFTSSALINLANVYRTMVSNRQIVIYRRTTLANIIALDKLYDSLGIQIL
jgi:hypothetical protein